MAGGYREDKSDNVREQYMREKDRQSLRENMNAVHFALSKV